MYLLSYDVRDSRRLRSMHKIAVAFGSMLQYSLYACSLTRSQRVEMKIRIENLIDRAVDRVIILDLGSIEGDSSWLPPYETLGAEPDIRLRRSIVI